jgi:hypothetical protein
VSPFRKDAAERVAVAFAEGVVGGLVLTGVTDKSMWLAALTGGVSAAVSALKAIVASRVGNADSASLTKTV